MFIPGYYYTHKNFRDVCIYVEKAPYRDSKRIKLKVLYWNLKLGVFCSYKTDNIEVKPSDLKNWSRIYDLFPM